MEILGRLFGSSARVKIMRLFLLNPEDAFENKDISKKSNVSAATVRKELAMLSKIGFVGKKSFFKEVPQRSKKSKPRKKRVSGWQLDRSFPMLLSLQTLLVSTEPLRKKEIINKLKRGGNIKLIVVSGIFLQNPDSRVDMLIVGDKLKKSAVQHALRIIESEVGKEISYALLETKEFMYRLNIYDKFIRDILDYPHDKILDKMGI
ncbi:MAG: hypothetical protein BMS9Abin13_423 [Patescibacteria group bacterium]|nr:MAG: hypothetical protein BMS9Abin13_423 [Patescibacteria group bacterium]